MPTPPERQWVTEEPQDWYDPITGTPGEELEAPYWDDPIAEEPSMGPTSEPEVLDAGPAEPAVPHFLGTGYEEPEPPSALPRPRKPPGWRPPGAPLVYGRPGAPGAGAGAAGSYGTGASGAFSVSRRGGTPGRLGPATTREREPEEQAYYDDLQNAQNDVVAANERLAGIEKALGEKGEETLGQGAKDYDEKLRQTQVLRDESNAAAEEYMLKLRERVDSHRNMKVDDDFFGRSTTGSKIGMIVSAMLGGWMNPRQQGTSPAIALIERAIERDIRNQEKAIEKAGADIQMDRAMFADSQQLTKSKLEALDLHASRLWGAVERKWKAESLKYQGQAGEQRALMGAAEAKVKKQKFNLEMLQRRKLNEYNERVLKQRIAAARQAKISARLAREQVQRHRDQDAAAAAYAARPHQFIVEGKTRDADKAWAGTKETGVSFGQFNRQYSEDDVLRRGAQKEMLHTHETISGVTDFLNRLRENPTKNVSFVETAHDKELTALWLLNVQKLAKAMEGNRITNEDISRYKQMIKGQMSWYQLMQGSNFRAVQGMIDKQMRIQKRQVAAFLTPKSSQYFRDNQKEYYQPKVGLLPKEPGNIPAATDRAIKQGSPMGALTVSAEMLKETEKGLRGATTPIGGATGKKSFYTRDDAITVLQKAIEDADSLSVDPKHDVSRTGIEKQTETWQVPGPPPGREEAFRPGGPALKGKKRAQSKLEVHTALVKSQLANYITRAVSVAQLDALMEEQGLTEGRKSIFPPGYHSNRQWGKANTAKIRDAYLKALRKARADIKRTNRKTRPVAPRHRPSRQFVHGSKI